MLEYYRWLGGCILKLKGIKFWKFYRNKFREIGNPLCVKEVIRGALRELIEEGKIPKTAVAKVVAVLKERIM